MAKLLKHVGASLRAKTHDEDDTAMKERGATGVFRNLAFQEAVEDAIVSPSSRTLSPTGSNKKGMFSPSNEMATSIDVSPRSRDNGQGATMWASPPHTPSPAHVAAKRAGSQHGCQTPKSSQRLATVKRPKNTTQVEEIQAFEQEVEERRGSEDGSTVIAVAHCVQPYNNNCPSTAIRAWEDEVRRLIVAGRHEDAVRWAAPSDGLIRCTVRRVKNFLGHTLAYHLYMDSGDTFILAARKRKKSKASNFVLSISQEDLGKDSESCISKLRANFVGTEYCLASRTSSVSGSGGEQTAASPSGRLAPPGEPFTKEELAVHYKQTVLTAKGGPRVMLVATPLPESNWSPAAPDGSDSLPNCLEAARRRELPPRLERQLCMLATRPPEWDSNLDAYTLDFHGRVRASSVKNFQLVHWDHNTDRRGSDLVLQFGKIEEGNEDFALDFTYPLTLQKAFAIALASTDSKLCYAL